MNREQAEALAQFLHLCRPEWDARGITHALGAAQAADPLNAGLAAIRWTANPDLRTPGGMGKQGEHWTERVVTGTPRPLRPDEACRSCGIAKHPANPECDGRPAPKTTDVTAPVAHLRALRDETAGELCRHRVPPSNCLDCMKRRDEDEPMTTRRETEPETDQPEEGEHA